jgi:cell division protease FtsH
VLSGNKIHGKYFADYKDGKSFSIVIPLQDRSVYEKLRTNVNDFRIRFGNTLFSNILISLVPTLLIIALLWLFLMTQLQGMGRKTVRFGKSRARLILHKHDRVTFSQIAGVPEAKEELVEIIEFLRDPKRFQKLGGRIPKGVLLMGHPGTGKTLLAKAIAGEADVPFFSISGSDFVELFAGVGASRVRNMFAQAKRHAPCIIFLDEIDAVGRFRGSGMSGIHDEREQTLNALLVEMDGFNTQEGVIILAATNRPDVLDPALLRPGRFDRQVVLDLPDIRGRKAILAVHTKKIVLADNVDLDIIARTTPGFSGADLANLVNESALLAARFNKPAVDMQALEESRDKVKWGKERRSRILDEQDRKITAYHEAGHALVLYLIPETKPLHKVTIIPRGIAYAGSTMQLSEKDRYMETKNQLLGEITGLMGGRAAEELILQDISTGAHNDIASATRIARLMVCQWGMSEKLGPVQFGGQTAQTFLDDNLPHKPEYSEAIALEIDMEIKQIINDCYKRAKNIISANKKTLLTLTNRLLEKEVLDYKDIEKIIQTATTTVKEKKSADV